VVASVAERGSDVALEVVLLSLFDLVRIVLAIKYTLQLRIWSIASLVPGLLAYLMQDLFCNLYQVE
jgi:hypothetical protein